MDKVTTLDKVIERMHDGMTVMIGGFLGIGAPLKAIEKLAQKGIKDLTLISIVSGNPPGGFDIAVLFKKGQVKKYITSHIGTSPEVAESINRGECELQLFPMGTLMEKIRCGGYGLGGVLTPVGLGTLVEQGKQKLTVDGKEYLLETPLHADVAFIKGYRADRMGNIQYRGVSINSNQTMASAADYTVAEVNEIVEIGTIDPLAVGTPGVFVKAVVEGYSLEEQEEIFCERWVQTGRLKQA